MNPKLLFSLIFASLGFVGALQAQDTVTTQPVNTTVVAGTTGTLSVAATGSALTYQWRKFGVPVAGATTATLALNAVSLADAGLYDVQVADGLTIATSAAARLDVRPAAFPTGALRPRPSFAPVFEINGTVNAIVPAPGGAFYAVGDFTTIDGVVCTSVARFLANGTRDSAFTPPMISGSVAAAVIQGTKLIIGGNFKIQPPVVPKTGAVTGRINQAHHIARLDAANGADDPTFAPPGNGNAASAIALQNDGKIIVGARPNFSSL